MYGSPDVLSALRSSRRYEQHAERSRSAPHRAADDAAFRRAPPQRARPDYGCVDWYVYEEERREHA